MKKSFNGKKRNAKFLKFCISVLLLFGLVSCNQQGKQSVVLPKKQGHLLRVNPANLPPPIKAKYIDPDSVAPPLVVPLKGQPKVMSAHPNVHPMGTPEVIQIPKDLKVLRIGKEIPLPKSIPVKGKVMLALQPKPKPIKAFRTKDAAIFNIQFLSDEQGIYSTVTCMLEDSRGNMWFANQAYIGRFDGNNFFVYSEKEGFLNGAINMMEDSKGNIWFTGDEGICYYDGTKVVHFNQKTGLASNQCRAPFEDSKGNIWFGNGANYVYCYDGKDFTIFNEQHTQNQDAKKQQGYYSDNRIIDIVEDNKGQIWWASQGSGVLCYDGQSITHFTEKDGLIHNYIFEILVDDEGQLWFGSGGQGTVGKGVSRYTPNPSEDRNVSLGIFTNYTKKDGLSDNRITGMTKDKSGNIWLATYASGINRYDGKAFTHYTLDEGLSFNSTLCILIDRKENIWVGTNGGGVSRFQPYSFRHFTEKQGLSKNWVHSIMEDGKGNIWMHTHIGGILKYNGKNFTHITEKEGLLQNTLTSIMEDSKGNLWFAYRDKGVSKFDGKKFTHYTLEQGLSFYFFWDLHEDKKGNIWVACGYEGGMTRINPNNGQITHFKGNAKDGIGGSYIMEDSQHTLWFGGSGKLAKFDAKNEEIVFTHDLDPIDKEWIEFLLEDDSENVWVGTATSFTQIKKEGLEMKIDLPRLTIGNGLPKTRLASVIIDKLNNIWVAGAEDGIALLQKGFKNFGLPNAQWLHFHKDDGLRASYFGSSYLDSNNRLWWGSVNGLTQLNLNNFQIPKEAPKNLSLSHIDLQGQFLDYRNLTNESYKNILAFGEEASQSFDSIVAFHNYPENLNLPYDVNHLTFHFSAIDWTAPHKIQYSYFMEGLDKAWSQANGEAKADYRSIPFGTYTFKVKAIGEAQVWSEPINYTFTIFPPWWHTWWAYGLYALLVFGASGLYIQSLRRKIQQKQIQLERELYLNQELTELNEANSRFVPHDFLQILGKTSLKELKLGDQIATKMTILFADIRDYTTLSEKISPEENFKFINAFLGRMGPIIQENGGFICQYMGDGIMALFKENHEQAIKAAFEMQKGIQRYNRQRFAQNREAIRLGIGLNTGQLMLGVIGDKNRYESSVISDAVNTASRMEGLTKVFGCSVIMSEKTLQEALLGDNFQFNVVNLRAVRCLKF